MVTSARSNFGRSSRRSTTSGRTSNGVRSRDSNRRFVRTRRSRSMSSSRSALCLAFLGIVVSSSGFSQDESQVQRQSAAMARYEAAKAVWDLASAMPKMGRDDFGGDEGDEARFRWSHRLAEAAVAAGMMPAAEAYGQHLHRMEEFASKTKLLHEGGRRSKSQVAAAEYFAADAKLQLV